MPNLEVFRVSKQGANENMIIIKGIPGQWMRRLCDPGFVGKRMAFGMIVFPDDCRTVRGIDIKRKNFKTVDMSNGPFGYDERTP